MEYLFKKLTAAIKSHSKIILMTHKRPDLDGMSSCIALEQICKSMKKEVYIVYPHQQVNISLARGIAAIKEKGIQINFLESKEIEKQIDENTLLIILDTQKPELVEEASLIDKINDIYVIDHHINSTSYIENLSFEYTNSNKSSVVEIIASYLKYLKKDLDTTILTSMIAGMEIDTNNYRLKTTEDTFKIAAYLTKKGADPFLKQAILNESREDFIRKYKDIKDSYYIKDGYLLCEMTQGIYENVDLALVADEMLKFDGTIVSFAVGKIGIDEIGVSARSMGKISASTIMNAIGGGGHITDAAAQIKNKTIKEVVEMIKIAIKE